MAEIINLADRRMKHTDPTSFFFDLRVWRVGTDVEGQILESDTGDGLSRADRLREIAKALDYLSWLAMQQAENEEPSEDGKCLAKVAVWESSRVRLRVNDDLVQTEAQEQWLRERLDDAKAIVADRKP